MDPGRTLPHQGLHGPRVAQARSGHEGVLHVEVEPVVRAQHGRDAAPGVVRGRIGALLLGGEEDPGLGRQLQGEREPGDSAADDQDVGRPPQLACLPDRTEDESPHRVFSFFPSQGLGEDADRAQDRPEGPELHRILFGDDKGTASGPGP